MVSVALMDVRSVVLKFGRSAERPIAGLILGAVLVAIGVTISVAVVVDLAGERLLHGTAAALLGTSPVTCLLGIWLCRRSLRKEFFLEVTLMNDSRKFPFSGNVERAQIEAFLREVSAFGDWARVLRSSTGASINAPDL